jgi:REP element-mobilizing transposase RayT
MREVCRFRGWIALAVHVRSNHVHAVVHGCAEPEGMMNDFKGYSTRALNRQFGPGRSRNWAEHGSTQYLWKPDEVEAAIRYTLYMQGRPMAVFPCK